MAMTGRMDGAAADRVQRRVLARAPEDLVRRRLVRLGEGINKVVYASDHWVVKRERRPSEIIALICVWKFLRKLNRLWPTALGRRLLERPGNAIRLLSAIFRIAVLPIPRGVWLGTHVGSLWKWHSSREAQGQAVAEAYLAGTPLVPARVTFPPTPIKVARWPGWLVASEAIERVEATLQDRINDLARARRFDEIELWLDRFLEMRRSGWARGVFSQDHHLRNYGIIEDRVVLIDAGGLTDDWREIAASLQDELDSPHIGLGLEMTLRDRPDIARRFDAQWRAAVKLEAAV